MTNLDDLGPVLTPAEAAALHDRPEGVAWFAIPAPDGAGVIARAHTEAHNGGLLLGYLASSDLAELQAVMPQGFFQQVSPNLGNISDLFCPAANPLRTSAQYSPGDTADDGP